MNRLAILLLISSIACADMITMKSGLSATTKILDTSGCDVKIVRNGNNVSIKKKLIKAIVWNSDTISYEGFVCPDKPRTMTRFEDTPEYKLMAVVDNAPELAQLLNDNARIAYLVSPLQGSYNADEFMGVESPLIDLLSQKAALQPLSAPEMISEISKANPAFDYLLCFRKYHVDVSIPPKNDLLKASVFGNESQPEKKKELRTFAEVILFDIRKKEIVFHSSCVEKRSVWGESEYVWTGILTDDEWKEAREKKQTDWKLDRNAQGIHHTLEKAISEYARIK